MHLLVSLIYSLYSFYSFAHFTYLLFYSFAHLLSHSFTHFTHILRVPRHVFGGHLYLKGMFLFALNRIVFLWRITGESQPNYLTVLVSPVYHKWTVQMDKPTTTHTLLPVLWHGKYCHLNIYSKSSFTNIWKRYLQQGQQGGSILTQYFPETNCHLAAGPKMILNYSTSLLLN